MPSVAGSRWTMACVALAMACGRSGPVPSTTANGVGNGTGNGSGSGMGNGTDTKPANVIHLPAVDHLFFAMTGDTRPHDCDQTQLYPKDQIAQVAAGMAKVGAQFAVDLGDHMFVCNGSLQEAHAQMGLYMDAIKAFPQPFFMTMGNHECGQGRCATSGGDANMDAFLEALKPVSALPYYSFDVKTARGLAVFVVAADDAWDSTEAQWLEATLARADAEATYTFVARHHPIDGPRNGNTAVVNTVLGHHYSLILTAHDHVYRRSTGANGRAVVVGLGGASNRDVGFGTVLEKPSGELSFVQYDANGNPGDSWSVTARN